MYIVLFITLCDAYCLVCLWNMVSH